MTWLLPVRPSIPRAASSLPHRVCSIQNAVAFRRKSKTSNAFFSFFSFFCQPTHLSHNTIPSLQTFRHLFLAFLSLSLSKMLTSMLSKNGAAAMRAAAAARRAPPHAFTASRGFAKDIKFGVDGRAAMLRGVDILADAVQVSLVYSFLGVLMDQQGSLSCSSS
jgi:hypothetical protein